MLHVLQIYLTSLQRQYYIGRPVNEGTKKPLNPFLGELFFCECRDPEGKGSVKVICEQVSHHPPTTAAFIEDAQNGVSVEAYSTQYTTLSGTSVVVRQSGHAVLTIDHHKESYIIPFPDVYVKSLLTGSPYPELDGKYRISSTSGLTAEINFGQKTKTKLFTGGERNWFEASIFKTNDKSKKHFFNLSGSWSDAWDVKDGEGKELFKFDLSAPENEPAPMMLAPLEKQNPWESRRAWKNVSEPLANGEFSIALSAKSTIENAQRDMRKGEKAEGKTWEQAFFTKVDEGNERSNGSALSKLTEILGKEEVKNIMGSDGCWRFDAAKAKRWNEGQRSRPDAPY